jgi:phytoene desaturase
MENAKKIVVIGAGFGGMASALRARAQGYDVTLVERLPALGGRAQTFEKAGFKHDAGPTVITAPFLFEELFALFNKDAYAYYDQVALDTWYEFIFEDGARFKYTGDLEHTFAEIGKFSEADVDGYKRLLGISEEIFNIGFSQLAAKPFTSFFPMLKLVPQLIRLKSYKTVFALVTKYIKNPYLQKIFSIHPLLVGGNPYSTTSIYTLIHYLERRWGIHFIMGGTSSLVAALEKLMLEEGIRIEKNFDTTSITTNPATGKAEFVECADGRRLSADAVIFNGDPSYAYENLFDNLPKRPKTMKPAALTQYSMGLYVLYFGTTTQYPDVAHHTIWLGKRHKELLHDIFDKKIETQDFSLYIHRPTATDPSFAPEGCDSFYVLCPVANLQSDVDWEVEGKPLRDRIVKTLSATMLPNLEEHITADFWMTPKDFETDYKSKWGAGFSIAPLFSQSAYFRYKNQDPTCKNVFFVGAGTHPGAGLPGVVSSAKVTHTLLTGYLG